MAATIHSLDAHRVARRPEMVEVERALFEGMAIELTVLRGEHATFVAQARQHNRLAQVSLLRDDTNAGLHWLEVQDQITQREIARIRAAAEADHDRPAIALRKAA